MEYVGICKVIRQKKRWKENISESCIRLFRTGLGLKAHLFRIRNASSQIYYLQQWVSFFNEKNRWSFAWKCFVASNFCWIWLILKHPYSQLLFTFGLIRVNPLFITYHDVIDVFHSTANVFLEHFFRQIAAGRFFWAIDKMCGIQCE